MATRKVGDPPCKDCTARGMSSSRKASYPGPRCFTHWKEEKDRQRRRAHERAIESTYGITGDQYWSLYKFQDKKCYICKRASGKSRRLSVDHDHRTGEVRGLLCRPCNTMIGHGRDDPEFFRRAALYLTSTPWRQFSDSRNGAWRDRSPDAP